MSSELWVWIHLPGDADPTLCGRLTHDGRMGRFVYGRSYLGNSRALPIDPVLLPLQEREFETMHLGGWCSALLDAGPDAWGKRIIERNFGRQDQRGYLLHAQGHPVGALSFSESRDVVPPGAVAQPTQTLAETLELHARVERGETLSAGEARRLLGEAGTGGARPKTTVEDRGRLWLVKGPSINDNADLAPVPVCEGALLALARELGIQAPEARVINVAGRPVLLTERFDRSAIEAGGFSRWRYASGMTLLWSRPAVAQYSYQGSYTNLARRLREWLPAPDADVRELYQRIVFNALVGNLDDHEKNHAVVAGPDGQFRLSPVFDLSITATTAARQLLALSFGAAGASGAEISLDNLLSDCTHYGYSRDEAAALIESQWQYLGAHALERFIELGCDEARAQKTLALMPGHRLFANKK